MSENPVSITLTPNKDTLEAWDKAMRGLGLKPSDINKALKLAINRSLDAAKTQAFKEAQAQYTVKRDEIKKTGHPRKATEARLSAELVFTGGRIPLLKFVVKPATPRSYSGINPKQRPGVYVQIRKDGGGQAPHLFVQNLQHDAAVYSRKRKDGSQRVGKFSLGKETGPSIVSMVGNEEAVAGIQGRADQMLSERIDHEMRRILSK